MFRRMSAKGGSASGGKTKKKRAILASLAVFAMAALAVPVFAAPSDRDLPGENEPFWTIFAEMVSPRDRANCVAAATSYVDSQNFSEAQKQGEIAGYTEMCFEFANMPAEMQSDMAAEGVATNLFSVFDWHNVNNLYFQKTDNGQLMGRISFSETIDFMSYDFMSFMSNFPNMVRFDDGYISLNAAMVPQMINYGTTFTMYGLDFSETPDIYVTTAGGSTMRKANASDLSGVSYDAAAGTLTFTPGHFSAFKTVAKGAKVKKMKISSVKKKTIKYSANQSSFTITIKGTSLYSSSDDVTCTLGFNAANVVASNARGKKITCQFNMSDFSAKGWYPLTVTAPGVGEVRKTNGVKIK